jgi:hypothetical protein
VDRRHRKGLQTDNHCALCSQESELVDHLMVQCVFSREVWFLTLCRCVWEALAPYMESSFTGWWVDHRKQVVKGRRIAFDSIVIAVVWSIWLQRNDCGFARPCLPPTFVALDDA